MMSNPLPIVNGAYVRALQELVKNAPFPRLIGMRLESIDIDSTEITLEVGEQHFQPFGMVHGGVLATLIDTATFWAAFLRLPEDAGLVNVDLKLNYLKPATGGRLTAEGRCIRAGRTINYAEAHVYDTDRTLLAHGTSTLMSMPGNGIDLGIAKFLPG